MKKNTGYYFRLIHRYLGFYLVGVMAVYAFSGTIMIFRRTDTFKKVTEVQTQLEPQLDEYTLGKNLNIKNLKITKTEDEVLYFAEGQYNQSTGEALYLKKESPYVIEKMEKLHKATTESPIYWLNVFFGVSLQNNVQYKKSPPFHWKASHWLKSLEFFQFNNTQLL
jgi:hypothetical protein